MNLDFSDPVQLIVPVFSFHVRPARFFARGICWQLLLSPQIAPSEGVPSEGAARRLWRHRGGGAPHNGGRATRRGAGAFRAGGGGRGDFGVRPQGRAVDRTGSGAVGPPASGSPTFRSLLPTGL